jgi:GNAT superfamily N-acetyltransferase
MTGDGYRLRLARLDEIAVLRAIEQTAAQRFRDTAFAWVADAEPGEAVQLMAAIISDSLLVAEMAGQPVAFLQAGMVDGTGYISEIDVLPDHAGHRLAARLIDAIEPWARDHALSRLTLSTFRDIPWNAPYYRRLGFSDLDKLGPNLTIIRERHRAMGLRDEDRVFMWRPVPQAI